MLFWPLIKSTLDLISFMVEVNLSVNHLLPSNLFASFCAALMNFIWIQIMLDHS